MGTESEASDITLIRDRRFADCGAENVIQKFEAMLASNSVDEAMFNECIELAQLLLD